MAKQKHGTYENRYEPLYDYLMRETRADFVLVTRRGHPLKNSNACSKTRTLLRSIAATTPRTG